MDIRQDEAVRRDVSKFWRRSDWAAWGLALLAMVPMLLIYVLHFTWVPAGFFATGFLQSDMPTYMADARAYFADGFSLTYGLPSSPDDATPRIYFQPLTLVLGLIQRLTGWDPGYVFAGFGVVAGLVMFRTAIALAVACSGRPRDAAAWLAYLVYLLGGGVIVILGLLSFWLSAIPRGGIWIWQAAFALDPGDGFWFLNLGRNVYYSTEAFYHVLFFASVILVLRRRYGLAAAMVAVMAASHPFTGLELILIVGSFSLVEFLFNRSVAPPLWFIATLAMLLAGHLGYYLVALSLLSPEHRVIEQQWSLAWVLSGANILAAYGPVMLLATVQLLWRRHWRTELARPEVRFLLVWFIIAFVLANHELLIAPRQPLHFTRAMCGRRLRYSRCRLWSADCDTRCGIVSEYSDWPLSLR